MRSERQSYIQLLCRVKRKAERNQNRNFNTLAVGVLASHPASVGCATARLNTYVLAVHRAMRAVDDSMVTMVAVVEQRRDTYIDLVFAVNSTQQFPC
jgi:predicted helicase